MLAYPAPVLDAIKRLFGGRSPGSEPAQQLPEHSLRLAAAALVFEVVRADGVVDAAELAVLRTALQGTFGLSAQEAQELAEEADRASRSAVSLYEFTRVVDRELQASEKKRIVELLWLVAFADAQKHPLEEHLVRKVAGLLHVDHPDFIDAKIRARAASDPSSGRS